MHALNIYYEVSYTQVDIIFAVLFFLTIRLVLTVLTCYYSYHCAHQPAINFILVEYSKHSFFLVIIISFGFAYLIVLNYLFQYCHILLSQHHKSYTYNHIILYILGINIGELILLYLRC